MIPVIVVGGLVALMYGCFHAAVALGRAARVGNPGAIVLSVMAIVIVLGAVPVWLFVRH